MQHDANYSVTFRGGGLAGGQPINSSFMCLPLIWKTDGAPNEIKILVKYFHRHGRLDFLIDHRTPTQSIIWPSIYVVNEFVSVLILLGEHYTIIDNAFKQRARR